MKSTTVVAVAIAFAGAMSACSTTSNTATAPAGDGMKAAAASPKQADSSKASGSAQSTMQSSALNGAALSMERSVYFEFDDSTISQNYVALIEKHGKYLMAAPSVKVKIEGNADERGSAEYNLALGQKRAEATMKALRLWGVRPSQMEATSWGEERPRDKGHEETAYSQNRRADIVYAAP